MKCINYDGYYEIILDVFFFFQFEGSRLIERTRNLYHLEDDNLNFKWLYMLNDDNPINLGLANSKVQKKDFLKWKKIGFPNGTFISRNLFFGLANPHPEKRLLEKKSNFWACKKWIKKIIIIIIFKEPIFWFGKLMNWKIGFKKKMDFFSFFFPPKESFFCLVKSQDKKGFLETKIK